ncbi:MAG: hypothetical protein OES24_22115 [Acidimicrobiia bacterium]|nr:hypothetical protein [Acidimicrobiia bacterium]
MLVELGPCPAVEAEGWTKFARRLIIELRSDPEAMSRVSPDMVDLWGVYIDRWSAKAAEAESSGDPFRWSGQIDPEVGEFLLHGLDKCLHSPFIREAATPLEAATHKPFTMTVVRAFVDGLASEGESCCHYVDQVLTSFSDVLDD